MLRYKGLLCLAFALATACVGAAELPRIAVSVPGPRNISYLPIDLIEKIGADRAAGVSIHLLHTGGGGVALNHLATGNADFAVAGLPAAMSLRENGGDVVCIAPLNDRPMFVLMVRSGLRGQVHRIADLRGRIIGVNTSTRDSKTTSQQLLELLLASDGVSPDSVRIVPAGQSWEAQSSLLLTGAADAVMGDEPYASRLRAEGKVFFLASLGDPALVAAVPGADFLHAAVETRSGVIAHEAWKVKAMVAMVEATLRWMAGHSPEEIVAALGVTDVQERRALVAALHNYPHAYSPDGRFSTTQLQHTEMFFRASSGDSVNVRTQSIDSIVDDRWVGRRP